MTALKDWRRPLGVLRPGLLPALSGSIARGRLALVVPLLFVDLALGAALSPARALASRPTHPRPPGTTPGDATPH